MNEKNKDSLAESGCAQCIKMGLGKCGRGTLRMPEKGLQDGTILFFVFNKYFGCAAHGIFSCSSWDLVPWPGTELGPLRWEHGVLATGPPGTPLEFCFRLSGMNVYPDSMAHRYSAKSRLLPVSQVQRSLTKRELGLREPRRPSPGPELEETGFPVHLCSEKLRCPNTCRAASPAALFLFFFLGKWSIKQKTLIISILVEKLHTHARGTFEFCRQYLSKNTILK